MPICSGESWTTVDNNYAFVPSNEYHKPEELAAFAAMFAEVDLIVGTGTKLLEVMAQLDQIAGQTRNVRLISIDYSMGIATHLLLAELQVSQPSLAARVFNDDNVDSDQSVVKLITNHTRHFFESPQFSAQQRDLVLANLDSYVGLLIRKTRYHYHYRADSYWHIANSESAGILLDQFYNGNICFSPLDFSERGAMERLRGSLDAINPDETRLGLYLSNTLPYVGSREGADFFRELQADPPRSLKVLASSFADGDSTDFRQVNPQIEQRVSGMFTLQASAF